MLSLSPSVHEVSTLSSRYVLEPDTTPEPGTLNSPAAAPLRERELIGRVIAGRYEVLRVIGRGGMGVVFEVLHLRLDKRLALKVLLDDHSDNPQLVRRFSREALAISKLSSPSTVAVFDFGVDDGLSYLVMELVEGRTLSAVLRAQGPLGSERVAEIASSICDALSEAHASGVVHRDIKPDNIMLVASREPERAEQVKVLDFGLAKIASGSEPGASTCRGVVLGTPFYMSPEQIRGERVDERTDLYALGALMYRALTGKHPFEGSAADVMQKHLTAELVAPHLRVPELGIHTPLSRVVARALARDPADRYGSAAALKQAIAAAMREEATPPPRPPAEPATGPDLDAYERRLKSPRAGLALLTAASIAVLAAGGLALWGTRGEVPWDGREREPNDDAETAQPLPVGAEVRGHLGRRLGPSQGDRDVFRVDLPPGGSGVALELLGLPNMGVCATVAESGDVEPSAQLCVPAGGRAALPLALSPGRWYLTVQQDTDPRGGPPVERKENVSDDYALRVVSR